jgi:hypothetical protein
VVSGVWVALLNLVRNPRYFKTVMILRKSVGGHARGSGNEPWSVNDVFTVSAWHGLSPITAAYDAMHSLNVKVHYLGCDLDAPIGEGRQQGEIGANAELVQ